jgi:hypothetical protein
MGFLKMQDEKSKRRSRLYVLLSLTAVLGIGGVVAATSISINSGTPLSLGAGYATATTCDADVTISTNQAYDTRENIYKITAFTVTGVDQSSTSTTTGIGCGAIPGKVMQLAYINNDNASISASWTLASVAKETGEAYIYTFGATAGGTVSGSTYYASVALTSFSISTLSTVALSIS